MKWITIVSLPLLFLSTYQLIIRYSEEALEEGVCAVRTEENDTAVFTMFKCPSNQKCSLDTLECLNITVNHYDGDSCEDSNDCYADLKCENNVCKGVKDGESCEYHYQCGKKSYCDSEESICKPLKKDDEECDDDEECGFFSLCDYVSDVSSTRTCFTPFSFENGRFANLYGYCKSGYSNSEDRCADVISENDGEECEDDSDCIWNEIVSPTENKTIEGECVYSYSGKYLCNWGTNSKSLALVHKIIENEFRRQEENPTHIAQEKRDYFTDSNPVGVIQFLSRGQFSFIDERIYEIFLGDLKLNKDELRSYTQ